MPPIRTKKPKSVQTPFSLAGVVASLQNGGVAFVATEGRGGGVTPGPNPPNGRGGGRRFILHIQIAHSRAK
ncbi:hypothetical protein NHQ30_007384 [Ciborinia camelliae]|nr:hypothetical protein NHQ30_007384 [Ciborinia camelliae]